MGHAARLVWYRISVLAVNCGWTRKRITAGRNTARPLSEMAIFCSLLSNIIQVLAKSYLGVAAACYVELMTDEVLQHRVLTSLSISTSEPSSYIN